MVQMMQCCCPWCGLGTGTQLHSEEGLAALPSLCSHVPVLMPPGLSPLSSPPLVWTLWDHLGLHQDIGAAGPFLSAQMCPIPQQKSGCEQPMGPFQSLLRAGERVGAPQ